MSVIQNVLSMSSQTVSVGKRGEVVIPAGFRKLIGLKYGSNLIISLQENNLVFTPKSYSVFEQKWQNRKQKQIKMVNSSNKTIDKNDITEKNRENFLENILKD